MGWVWVIARATETPIVALDEIAELATVWMILLGVIALWRRGLLYSVDFRPNPDSRVALFLDLLVQLAMLAFAALVVWQGEVRKLLLFVKKPRH